MFRFLRRRAWILMVPLVAGAMLIAWQERGEPELARAEQAIAERRFAEADQLLEKHLSTHPEDSSARLLAARTSRQRHRFDEASRRLMELENDPSVQESVRLENRLLALMHGQLSEAEETFAYCRSHPNEGETPLVLEALIIGTINSLAPDFSEHKPIGVEVSEPRIERVQRMIALWLDRQTNSPDQMAGLLWRARVRHLANDRPGALADLRRVLETRPDDLEAAYYYALFIASESPMEARDRFGSLARSYPDNPFILFAWASSLRSTGSLDQSAETLDRLIALYPTNPNPVLERGLVALDAQQPAVAEPLLRKALELSPRNGEIYAALARCMLQLNKAAEARRFQDRFLKLEAEKARAASPFRSAP
jgi:predicted Zn-dependent protease